MEIHFLQTKSEGVMPVGGASSPSGHRRHVVCFYFGFLIKGAIPMYHNNNHTLLNDLYEQMIQHGPDSIAKTFITLFNLAMHLEREHLGASHYQRSQNRQGYANGIKNKTIDTPVGSLTIDIPKTAGCDEPFYPQSLERGRRSSRAIMGIISEMYVKGVSTRSVEKVVKQFGLTQLSSSPVSRANKLLDEELEKWHHRPLGQMHYLQLDARYEKVRVDGMVRSCAVLVAYGVDEAGKRQILGVSVSLSEAEVHWHQFLDS